MSFEIAESTGADGATVLTVSGEIRDGGGYELLSRIRAAVDENPEVILNLRQCVFLQPSHLTSILRLRRQLAADGGSNLSSVAAPPTDDADPVPAAAPAAGTSPGALKIEAGMAGDTYVLAMRGELGLETFDRFELAFEAALVSGADRILLDIEELTFIDSTGLQSIMRAKRRTDADGRLRMTRGTGDVADLFRLTALDLVLPFE